jgi:hypothetical protein
MFDLWNGTDDGHAMSGMSARMGHSTGSIEHMTPRSSGFRTLMANPPYPNPSRVATYIDNPVRILDREA